jgi:hypothetical protein
MCRQTLKNLLYFDLNSHDVKSAQHACYDQGMNDVADPPPTTRLVRFTHGPFPAEAALLETLDLDVSENPFQDLRTLSMPAASENSHLGFVLCALVLERSPSAGICNGRRELVGAYVVPIQRRSIFNAEEANLARIAAFDASAASDPAKFVFAPNSLSLRYFTKGTPFVIRSTMYIPNLSTSRNDGSL